MNLTTLQTDIHAHLIPGIDDGPEDMEKALKLIQALADLGYQKLYATPHVMVDHYPNEVQDIQKGLDKLKCALKDNNIHIEIAVAAEYFLDEHFDQLLEKDQIIPLHNNHVLIEVSTLVPPQRLHEQVFALKTKGYKPILAHPERYPYYADDFKKYNRIKEYGCKLQINIPSLAGYYGRSVKKTATKLIQHNLADYLGTDAHHLRHVKALHKALSSKRFRHMLENYPFLNSHL